MIWQKNFLILFTVCSSSFYGINNYVFFSPFIKMQILRMIRHEQKSIRAAMYTFTDLEIAQELVAAVKRGIHTQIILDQNTRKSFSGKGLFLQQHGVSVGEFKPLSSFGIMHHKYWIFSDNKANFESDPCLDDGRMLTVTGSYNCTQNAHANSCENIIVSDDPGVALRFWDNFLQLNNRSVDLPNSLDADYKKNVLSKKIARIKNSACSRSCACNNKKR